MVDSINSVNNSTNTKVKSSQPQPSTIFAPQKYYNDELVIANKKPKKQSLNDAQKLSLGFAGASTLFMGALAFFTLKSIGIGKNKKLLKEIEAANLPVEIKSKIMEEYKKLKSSLIDSSGSRLFIEEALKLAPCFKKVEPKVIEVEKAKSILDKKIIGMDEVKEQILDFIKVRNYHIKNGTFASFNQPLMLAGPAGTGKTSIAEAIAEALEVPFESIQGSGISGANQVIGDRRVFLGASPGRIIKSMQHAGCSNPVIFIDECDKFGHNLQQGDPMHALLDFFEPKFCKHFVDSFFEFPVNLLDTFKITAVNDLSKVPTEIKNRCHIIYTKAYTDAEKKAICDLNIKNTFEADKISPEKVKFTDSAITQIVKRGIDPDGTVSAGARTSLDNLQQIFNKILGTLSENPNAEIKVDKNYVNGILDKFKSVQAA